MSFLYRPALRCLRYPPISPSSIISTTSKRTFTSLLRPSSILPRTSNYIASTIPRPTLSITSTSPFPSIISPSQSSSILPLTQTRGHRRKTYNPSHIVRKRRFGFLARLRSKTGKNIIKRRKEKGRKALTH
ncbi:hypothetical protein TWF694_004265 [Orbilia ellipsospora]|uniref:Ribosomal protein L34 n=1 Tax=Orbilia ellipsospora TaxID=2528407 RepID=A0AAV9WYU6_9PEZI